MILRSYRICKAEHSEPDGFGASQFGGRWNSPGNAVVYTSDSRALATLEILVHAEAFGFIESSYVVRSFEFDEQLAGNLDRDDLPAGWNADVVNESSLSSGDDWIAKGPTPVLRVPSVVVPDEFNYLLNPRHPDFSRIEISDASPFDIDQRLT